MFTHRARVLITCHASVLPRYILQALDEVDLIITKLLGPSRAAALLARVTEEIRGREIGN